MFDCCLCKQYAFGFTTYSQEEQPSTSILYQEKTTIVKTALKPRQEKDAYHLPDRPGQVVLARLRTDHNRLNAHMDRKLKLVPSPTCPCGEEDQTTAYVTDTNQIESHSGHQQLRFTINYMGAWRTWRRPPTSSLLLDWSCRRTRRRRWLIYCRCCLFSCAFNCQLYLKCSRFLKKW